MKSLKMQSALYTGRVQAITKMNLNHWWLSKKSEGSTFWRTLYTGRAKKVATYNHLLRCMRRIAQSGVSFVETAMLAAGRSTRWRRSFWAQHCALIVTR